MSSTFRVIDENGSGLDRMGNGTNNDKVTKLNGTNPDDEVMI